ncbi:MAG: Gfo/Idh/MocA family oxidoreductase [Candidatus Bathyarchaeia archaeon]|jgi:predicted dehydrogenase
MENRRLRVGVVGLGKMGLVHSSILSVLPNAEVTILCEKSGMLRRFFSKIFRRVPVVDDVSMFSDQNLDAVFVTTPINSHFPVAHAVYSDKLASNLFVEKTLASSFGDSQELCARAREAGGINMVGYLRRFYVTFKKAKSLLDESTIGELSTFKAYAFSSDFVGNEKDGEFGGVLSDLGCYAMDLALWFFGDVNVKPESVARISEGDVQNVVRFELNRADGFSGTCDVSWRMKNYRMPEVGFLVEGSKGKVQVDDDRVELKLNDGNSRRWFRHDLSDNVPFWLSAPEYYREDEYFVRCALDGFRTEPSFESACKVDKMIDDVKSRLKLRG